MLHLLKKTVNNFKDENARLRAALIELESSVSSTLGMGPMGIQGVDAEQVEAMRMLYTVTRYKDEIVLEPNDNVSIGG